MKNLITLLITLAPLMLEAPASISISGNPPAMSITTATAGLAPNPVTNSTTTYNVTTILTASQVLGKINSNMPTGVTLSISLAAPLGGTSAGLVSLNTTNKTLVSNIPIAIATGLQITYQLSATSAAVPSSNVTRTVTLTVQ